MHLLLLTPQLPYPPQQGTTIRNYNLLRGLAAHHEIDLLTFGSTNQLRESPLASLCRRIEFATPPARTLSRRAFETFASSLPDMARRLDSPALKDKLTRMLAETRYDVVQIEGIEMGSAWLSAPAVLHGPCVVFDDHNAEYVLQRTAYESDRRHWKRFAGAVYSYIQWRKLARFERELCLRSSRVVAVSRNDASALAALDPRIHPVVIPNGVDLEYYTPSDTPPTGSTLVFTGKMDYRPNVDGGLWFVHEILPLVRREIADARIALVGQKPNARVQALAAEPGVMVTGWVPDTRPHIAEAAVYVVPLRMGGGTRLKVLEAMAMGKAIVSTARGAEGIEYTRDRELVIADSPDEFARAVAALLRDPARRRELGANARRLAEEKYDWKRIVPRFETIYAASR